MKCSNTCTYAHQHARAHAGSRSGDQLNTMVFQLRLLAAMFFTGLCVPGEEDIHRVIRSPKSCEI